MNLTTIVKEIITEAEEDQLSAAMAQSFKVLGAEFEQDKEAIQQDVENAPTNEALGALGIIGILLAAPKVVELLAKGLRGLISTYKKFFGKNQANTEEEQRDVAEKIINFTHKWHKSYIKGLNWIFKISGIYKKKQITDPGQQMAAATKAYYVIIACLAIYSGIGAFGAFKAAASTANLGDFSLGTLETVMASIKSGEFVQFMSKIGLK